MPDVIYSQQPNPALQSERRALSQKRERYCWRTQKCRNMCVPHTFVEGKKAGKTCPRIGTPRTLKGVRQQYQGDFRDTTRYLSHQPRLLFLCHPSAAQCHAALIGGAAIGNPLNEMRTGKPPLSAHPCGRDFTFAGEVINGGCRDAQQGGSALHIQDFLIHHGNTLPAGSLRLFQPGRFCR